MFDHWVKSGVVAAVLSTCAISAVAQDTPAETAAAAAVKPESARHANLALQLMPVAAKVVGAIDFRALDQNPAMEQLWVRFFRLPNVQHGLQQLQEAFAFDFQKDLKYLVIGAEPHKKGSEFVVIEGRFDTALIQQTLLTVGADMDVNLDYTVYHFIDQKNGGEHKYVSFLRPDLLVIGRKDAVDGAIDCLREMKATDEPRCSAAARVKGLPGDAVLRFGVSDVARLKGDENPIQPLVDSLAGAIRIDASFHLTLEARCKTENAAKNIRKMAEGGAALLKLVLEKQPELAKVVGNILDSAQFSQEDVIVAGAATMPVTDAINGLVKILDHAEQKRQMEIDDPTGRMAKAEF